MANILLAPPTPQIATKQAFILHHKYNILFKTPANHTIHNLNYVVEFTNMKNIYLLI